MFIPKYRKDAIWELRRNPGDGLWRLARQGESDLEAGGYPMSGIGGTLSFGPAPARPDLVEAMNDALGALGPDDYKIVQHENVTMIHRALHVTPESHLTRQPMKTDDGLLVAWDGRLDNRLELERHLDLRADFELPDVDIIVQCYCRWGDAFLEPVVGDFAVALWDTTRRRLHLGRDPFGARALFFAVSREWILWASSLRALFATGEITPEVDDDWVDAYLVNAHAGDQTPFLGVETVSPGEIVTFGPESQFRRRFWKMEDHAEIRYKSDTDYEDEFRSLFYEAVKCRLRTRGVVCCELSGGLDSSSIVCVVDDLLRRGEVDATDFFTYSIVYDQASEADEREFIRPVELRTGRRAIHILEDDFPALAGFAHARPQVPFRYQNWPELRRRVVDLMEEGQAKSVLSGFGGDQILWSEISFPLQLADYAARLQLRRLLRGIRSWHWRGGYPYPALLWDGVVRPLWYAAWGRGSPKQGFEFAWLTERLRSRIPQLKANSLGTGRRFQLPSRRMRYDTLRRSINSWSWLVDDLDQGYEISCPFLHRPLVEYCLALPFDQLVRPGEMRSLHRRALRGVLPDIITDRQDKRGPSEATMRGIRREWPVIDSLLGGPDARIYARGYVHRKRFLEQLEKVRFGFVGEHAVLVRALEVEVWLRSLEQDGPMGV